MKPMRELNTFLMHIVVVLFGFTVIANAATAEPVLSDRDDKQASPKVQELASTVDRMIEDEMKNRHIPGASVAVVLDGSPILAKGYGYANVELKAPATDATVYQLASVTKQFTATAVMLLIEDGKLKLEDKISSILTDLPKAWQDVTVLQLLTHTSGIKSYTSVGNFMAQARKDFKRQEILDLVAKEPLEFTPGSKWNYSNTGYFLLGLVIEKASGKTYEEFLTERIFKPLEMTQTRLNDLHAIIPERAQGYTHGGKGLKNGEYVSPTQPYSAGALVSSIKDMIKWDAALAGERILKKPALERMWEPIKLSSGKAADYGLGWGVGKVNDRRFVGHGGGIPGFSTQINRYLDDNLTVIVLMNTDSASAGSLANKIAAVYVPALAPKIKPLATDPDPKTTAKLEMIVKNMLKGEFDASEFTDEANKELVPKIKEDHETLEKLGDLKMFELVERKENGDELILRYHAQFKSEAMSVIFRLAKDRKVAGIGIRPE